MKFEDLKQAFANIDEDTQSAGWDVQQIREQVSSTRRKIDLRDLRESIACVVVIVLFAPTLFMQYPVMTRIGAAVTCTGALFIGIWLYLGNRRHRPRPELSVDEYLGAEISHLDYQIRLLRNVTWWYLAPLAVGFLMFVWGLGGVIDAVVLSMGYYLIDRLIQWLNQRAVDKHLLPQREEIARVRQSLNEENELEIHD